MELTHANFGWLHAPPNPVASCHCLVLRDGDRTTLVDSGIGLRDIEEPVARIGQEAIDAAGFQFIPASTAYRQLEAMGCDPASVTDIVLTHCDPDHVGGLADFPNAVVHVGSEEKDNLDAGNPRYSSLQFAHEPRWKTYRGNDCDTLGLPSRKVETEIACDIRLVPLFGHTRGHCGVAVKQESGWVLHVGDAYYLRVELDEDQHPVCELARSRADDDQLRLESLDQIRHVLRRHGTIVTIFGYHDTLELPANIPSLNDVD